MNVRVKATIILAAFGLATGMTACTSDQTAEAAEAYCVDVNGVVVDDDFCDPDDEGYNPTYIIWETDDHDTKFKKGKKIPGADFRKGTTKAPSSSSSSAPKSSAGKSSSAPKSSAKSSAPKASQPKASAPKAQSAPKAKTGK